MPFWQPEHRIYDIGQCLFFADRAGNNVSRYNVNLGESKKTELSNLRNAKYGAPREYAGRILVYEARIGVGRKQSSHYRQMFSGDRIIN